jgi:hypothetical protein
MAALLQDLHNQRLYGPSLLYYLGMVRFSSLIPSFWRVQRISPASRSSVRRTGSTGILSSCAWSITGSGAVQV